MGQTIPGISPTCRRSAKGEGDDLEVQLVNGLLVETVRLGDVTEIRFPAREETTALPVIDLTEGYEKE